MKKIFKILKKNAYSYIDITLNVHSDDLNRNFADFYGTLLRNNIHYVLNV